MLVSSPPRTLALVVLLLVGTTSLTGCVELLSEEEPPQARADHEDGWIRITLTGGSQAPYERGQIESTVRLADGLKSYNLCSTAELGDRGCAEAFSEGSSLDVGERVWFPCFEEATYEIELQVSGEQVLDEEVACEASTVADDGEDEGAGAVSATAAGTDLDDDGNVEWIRVTLTRGENTPYPAENVTRTVTNHDESRGFVCERAHDADCQGTEDAFSGADGDEWDVGQNLWIPCQGEGPHYLTIWIYDTTVIDTSVDCGQAAA